MSTASTPGIAPFTRRFLPVSHIVLSKNDQERFNFEPLVHSAEGTEASTDETSGIVHGITIGGWEVRCWKSSSIANESELEALTTQLEDSGSSTNSGSRRRRMIPPEIVFVDSKVELKHTNLPSEDGLLLTMGATDALQEWSQAHSRLRFPLAVAREGEGQEEDGETQEEFRGVSVLQVADAQLWKAKHQGRGTDTMEESEFHYDWTYSTPYTVTISTGNPAWTTLQSSGINMTMLTNRTLPILMFDELTLYEDDLHDNGLAALTLKLRVMPTCWFTLLRLFVRVDHVLVRCREVRIYHEFAAPQRRVYRDVTWREVRWGEPMRAAGLPTEVSSWTVPDCVQDDVSQRRRAMLENQIRQIPEVSLPSDIPPHSYLELGPS